MTNPSHQFCIDENIAKTACEPLSALFPHHHFETVHSLGLNGMHDVPLFETLDRLGFEAIITADQMHLVRGDEHKALVACGLHWIGFAQVQGVRGRAVAATQTATILTALPSILTDWRDTPHRYEIRTLPKDGLVISPL